MLVALLLVALAEFQQKPRWSWLIGAGATLAAFALNRENARVLYPVVVFWLVAGFRDVLRSSASRLGRSAYSLNGDDAPTCGVAKPGRGR